ncbi:hypothetical protein SAMN05444397_10892 [Flavobacterium aquidurense]|uniref:Uncharacterized protein n=1 Tax=Flavobacterium frigidimaris TaxID=262320 RepID=A0ABX4BQL7_FLAFR|nr:hypothetical protein [Flavobacterium frigidimaris]OXA78877.1 hypothetical protein B0A65_11845 [Flavobacterium frigidimaris]SDZ51945.1 hypothetical protein SAMN05444397_10892 [Flavobacterium aquidurense]
MKIELTKIAEESYFEIINKYSEAKTASFSKSTISILHLIQQNNLIGSRYKKTFYRKFLISNQVFVSQNRISNNLYNPFLGQQKKSFKFRYYT